MLKDINIEKLRTESFMFNYHKKEYIDNLKVKLKVGWKEPSCVCTAFIVKHKFSKEPICYHQETCI